jgi:hypothetical protein
MFSIGVLNRKILSAWLDFAMGSKSNSGSENKFSVMFWILFRKSSWDIVLSFANSVMVLDNCSFMSVNLVLSRKLSLSFCSGYVF